MHLRSEDRAAEGMWQSCGEAGNGASEALQHPHVANEDPIQYGEIATVR